MANRISRYCGSSGFNAKDAEQLAAHIEKTLFDFFNERNQDPDNLAGQSVSTSLVALDKVVAGLCAYSVEADGWPECVIEDVQIGCTNLTRHHAKKMVLDVLNFYVNEN